MAESVTSTNLDLTDVDNAEHDTIVSRIETFYKADSAVKSQLSWHWERNHLMLDGRQWIVFDGERETGGIWRRLKVAKQNEYIPRPVTNYIFDSYQTLKSYLLKSKPSITVKPNTSLYKDKQAAKLATLVSQCNYVRLKEQYNYEYAASTLITYGTVFKKSYWDTSVISMIKVPRLETLPGQVDPMTGLPGQPITKQAVDPATGDPLFDELPLGDVNTDTVEPYRIALDPLAMDLHKCRWVMEYSIQPLDWIIETYSRDEEGYTGLAETVTAEKDLSGSMRRFFQLKTSSGVKANTGTSNEGATTSDNMVENAAVVKEYYERPSRKYPKGRLLVVASNVLLYAGESPYSGPELGDWHPYSECRWELVPGRFWGKSPFDDACEIQKQVNSIDSVIILTRKSMAIPQKKIPIGAGITPGQWTGRPGQEIFYRDQGTGASPETIPAAGVDQTVFEERAQKVSDIKTITGAIDILKGDRPPGVTAASALNMLYEVGTGKLFPILDRWKAFIENDQKKQLRLISRHYKEPRPDFIQLLKSHNEELSEKDINNFLGSDLFDNCNVIVEAGSNIPKLQAAKQAQLVEMAQMGSLGLENPANRAEFNRQMGVTGFDSDIEPDTKRAEWENDLLDNLLNSPDNQPVVLDADIDEIHIKVHQDRMKKPSFVELPFPVQQAYMQHIMAHEQNQAQKQQSQMMAAMAANPGGPIPPPEQPPATQEKPMHTKGPAPTKQMRNAIHADALVPAPIGGEK